MYNIEEYKYKDLNETDLRDMVKNTSEEDKCRFILNHDEKGDFTYFVNLKAKYDEDFQKGIIKKDKFGKANSNSLLSWLKKHDVRHICSTSFSYGKVNIFGSTRFIQNELNHVGCYDRYYKLTDEIYYRLLKICKENEEKYFNEHDSYMVKLKEMRNSPYILVTMIFGGSVYDTELVNENGEHRKFTEDELDYLIQKQKEIESTIAHICSEVKLHITF